MSQLGQRLLLSFLLTLAADYLLFGSALGIGLTLFTLLAALPIIAHLGRKLLRAKGWLLVWCLIAINTLWETSLLGTTLLIVMTWIVLALAVMPETPRFFTGFLRGMTGGARSFTLLGSDLRRWALITNRILLSTSENRGGIFRFLPPFWVYALPAGLIVIFAVLIIPANLVLSQWTSDTFNWLWEQLTTVLFKFEFDRLLFWAMIGVGVYGLIRFRLGRHPAHHPRKRVTNVSYSAGRAYFDDDKEPADPRHELQACLLTFGGLNLLYLAANLTDLFYIWLHADLPAGMTYAQFAHHGSYRLIVAVVLAAVLVPAFYRIGVIAATDPRARMLAFAFIVQNMVVLLGAARRLMIYDEVYGLSRFRLATFLWLALVMVGFILTFVKLARHKSFQFLVESNAISTVLLLTLVGWMNLDGFIADWNVSRYEAKQTNIMDVEYLGELDAGALPAIRRLTTSPDRAIADKANQILQKRIIEEATLMQDWRNWTWQRSHAVSSIPRLKNPG